MATDTERPDTEEREKPGPAKRQRLGSNQSLPEACLEPESQAADSENSEEVVVEEEDRRAREKLRCWQICQVIRSFMDNTINRVIEEHSRYPPYSFQDPSYCLFRGDRVEDTAISEAIRNHGLICSSNLSQLPSLRDERVVNLIQNAQNASVTSVATVASETSFIASLNNDSTSDEGDWVDNNYDTDHQQDFLDRAVAEAIKKKGLSTLNVDYG